MNFVRSVPSQGSKCAFGKYLNVNIIGHYILSLNIWWCSNINHKHVWYKSFFLSALWNCTFVGWFWSRNSWYIEYNWLQQIHELNGDKGFLVYRGLINMVFSGFREQLNELTHWIDGSAVYGSTQAQLEELLDPAINGNKDNKWIIKTNYWLYQI